MSQDLNHEQQIFLLNVASNLVSWKKGDPHQTVKELADNARDRIGDVIDEVLQPWEIVWGPAVYMHEDSGIADHVLFAAAREAEEGTPAQLVISIAGSNGPLTSYNWQVNNLLVKKMEPWKWGGAHVQKKAKISQGNWIGFENLKNLQPLGGFPGEGQAIREFLKSRMQPSPAEVEVTITGFSLGGGLTPILGLWLEDTQDEWNASGNASIHCRPAAGPATGNQPFAEHFNHKLEARTQRLSNELDVVPHAWNSSDLRKIPTIYEGYAESRWISTAIFFVRRWVRRHGYTHVNVAKMFNLGILQKNDREPLVLPEIGGLIPTGTGDSDAIPSDGIERLEKSRSDLQKFLEQVQLQHTRAYLLEMKIDDIRPGSLSEVLESASGMTNEALYELGSAWLEHLVELELQFSKNSRK